MKRFFLLLATLAWAQVAIAVESKHIDDAPKGFIHITGESYGAEVHRYIRANTVVRLEQFSEENDGELRHYIRLYTTGAVGQLGGSSGEGKGELRQQFFQIEYATKEEADKVRKRLLELLSAKESACTLAIAELTPIQVEAKRSLEKTAQMKEYGGSIFAHARNIGIDYRPILKRAIDLNQKALISLFTVEFNGEGAGTHCAILKDLMMLWGDTKFAEVLVSQPMEVRDLVISSIDYSWADPDWASYPKTLAASPVSASRPKPKKAALDNPLPAPR